MELKDLVEIVPELLLLVVQDILQLRLKKHIAWRRKMNIMMLYFAAFCIVLS